MRRLGILVLLLPTLLSCSTGPDRSDVVTSLARSALMPLISNAADEVDQLASDVSSFCQEPSTDSLATAQASWAEAETTWKQAEVTIYYGPAPMLRTVSKVDFEPVSEAGIDELLASDAVIDFDYVDNRSAASRRGLGAVEYLLFRPVEDAADARSCELATTSSAVAAASARVMLDAWTEGMDGGEPFGSVFTTTMTSNDALADVVGAQYEILKRLTLSELGKALGVTAQEPDLLAIPEGAAEQGPDRYLAQVAGVEMTLRAGGESSLLELIRSRSDEVAGQIEMRLDSAVGALRPLVGNEGGMVAAVESSPERIGELLDDLSALRDLIHVDVVSLLDLTLGFSDADGDTG